MKEEQKIKYKNLSWQLKIGVLGGWFVLIVYGIMFISGMIIGMWGV